MSTAATPDHPEETGTISHEEAQELHRLIGGLLQQHEDNTIPDKGDAVPDLERALELASLVVADTANAEGIDL